MEGGLEVEGGKWGDFVEDRFSLLSFYKFGFVKGCEYNDNLRKWAVFYFGKYGEGSKVFFNLNIFKRMRNCFLMGRVFEGGKFIVIVDRLFFKR